MKKALVALALASLLLCGCDSFRRLAGRPTSADIAAKKQLIEAEEAAHQARLDSLRRVQKEEADSLTLVDEIKSSNVMVLRSSAVKGLRATGLDRRYYVIVGTFSSPDNAKLQASKAGEKGYTAALIPYYNGFTAVGINGTDRLRDAWETLHKVSQEPFCPKDAWMLINE